MPDDTGPREALRRLRCVRDADLGGAAPVRTWTGGMKWGRSGTSNCSWPLATLKLFSTGVELGPSVRALLPLVPVWRARFAELSVIEVIETRFPRSQGVRFTPTSGSSISFGAQRLPLDEVLLALERFGLPVDRTPQRVRLIGPP